MLKLLKRSMAVATLCAAELLGTLSAKAGPVEYVKVCSLYGAGYFYIPGTDRCQNANQITANQNTLSWLSSTAFQGVAISTALVSPFVPANANYAISVHWGDFEGSNAIAAAGLARLGNTNFFLSAGVGVGVAGGPTVERAGFMFAW